MKRHIGKTTGDYYDADEADIAMEARHSEGYREGVVTERKKADAEIAELVDMLEQSMTMQDNWFDNKKAQALINKHRGSDD